MASAKKRSRPVQWLILVLVLLAAGVVTLGQRPQPRPALPARDGPALSEARSWGYQLQKLRPRLIPAGVDVMVVDYSRDGSAQAELTPTMIEMLRKGDNGRRRIVLCYISIGEAEDYRYYWWRHWKVRAPEWLGQENKEWKGNYPVRYWQPAWQRIIYDPAPTLLARLGEIYLSWRKPYLERIIEMGFDGVYLDRVDVFQEWEKSRKGARAEMIRFVTALSAHAKSRKPGFLIVPQNGEELLASATYRKAIDGVAKEDLYFGVDGDETVNDGDGVQRSVAWLNRARADNLPVLVVEYLSDPGKRQQALREITRHGFIPLFAERALEKPPQVVPLPPPAAAPPPAAPPPAQPPRRS